MKDVLNMFKEGHMERKRETVPEKRNLVFLKLGDKSEELGHKLMFNRKYPETCCVL